MIRIGLQTHNAISDEHPAEDFMALKEAGFSCADFSLHYYLKNTDIYRENLNSFFDKDIEELKEYFRPHKEGAEAAGIDIFQMHMPYPILVPNAKEEVNHYLQDVMAPKSLEICSFLNCKYIVIHGFKIAKYIGSEEEEWKHTEAFIRKHAPMVKELGITICVENLYESVGSHIVEGPCCNARKAAERIDRINEDYGAEVVGFCFDTGHANIAGIDFEDFLMILGKRLKVLHIHDNDGIRDLHQIPFTFTRTRDNKPSTDWDGFIRALKVTGFDGVLNFETSPVLGSFPPEMRGDVLRFIARIGNYFAEQIDHSEK